MTELSLQSEFSLSRKDEEALQKQKRAAINKNKRRIEAARNLYAAGEMTREEYLVRKEEAQRQIAHWEARTAETEQAAIELRLCMEAVDKITTLWESGSDEEKAQLAKTLFEDIVFDMDTQRITGFHLKPWAGRYLTLRASLYAADETFDLAKENATQDGLKSSTVFCPIGAVGPGDSTAPAMPWNTAFAWSTGEGRCQRRRSRIQACH